MPIKRTPLTGEQFEALNTSGWIIKEVAKEYWKEIPGLERLNDTVAVMVSGCITDPKILKNIHAIAGLDVLVGERRQKEREPEGNAYHYIVQRTCRLDFPFLLHGPFPSGTIVPHWFKVDDLSQYWADSNSRSDV